jgi:hypothetical protein
MTTPASAADTAAADPAEAIRRYCRSITAALRAIDLASPGATVITDRMRGTLDTLLYDLGEVRYFTRQAAKGNR